MRKKEDSDIIQVRNNIDLINLKANEDDNDQDQRTRDSQHETDSTVSHLSEYEYYCDSDM